MMAEEKNRKNTLTLSKRTIIAIILSCLLLSTITQIITVYNYTKDLLAERIRAAHSITYHARSSIINGADSIPFARKVMDVYYKLPPEVHNLTGTDQYRAYYQDIRDEYPEVTATMTQMLRVFMNAEDISDVYAAMYDRQNNAGHEFPVLYRKGKSFELIKDRHSLFVGGLPGVEYSEYTFTMKRGDKLFVYTDGIPEASNKKKEFFGMDRLLASLNKAPDANPRQTIENMEKCVKRFVGTAEQFDDITMLCFEYKG